MQADMTEKFGRNLKTLRKERGITQEDMANTINTSRSCISNYESGNREPDNETIRIIADYFGVSIDFLLGRSAVKTVFKDDDVMCKLHELLSNLESVKSLDMTCASTYIKCLVVEFYNYLIKKESKNN